MGGEESRMKAGGRDSLGYGSLVVGGGLKSVECEELEVGPGSRVAKRPKLRRWRRRGGANGRSKASCHDKTGVLVTRCVTRDQEESNQPRTGAHVSGILSKRESGGCPMRRVEGEDRGLWALIECGR